jgi:hypothetical protein
MFGLMRIKEHERRLDNVEGWCKIWRDGRKKEQARIVELEKELTLEKARSNYWKLKSQYPEIDPVVLGSKEELEYIRN